MNRLHFYIYNVKFGIIFYLMKIWISQLFQQVPQRNQRMMKNHPWP